MSDETTEEPQASGEAADDWAEAMAEQASEETTEQASEQVGEAVQADSDSAAGGEIAAAGFDSLVDEGVPGDAEVNLDVILDIPVTISMEIGRSRINIRNLLQLNQGSVIELDRLAGEPMDVLINGTLIAHGEVVVVNEKFGIRLTDVISPVERVRKLK